MSKISEKSIKNNKYAIDFINFPMSKRQNNKKQNA